jgi:ubiquitin fusion degradation protein 1
MASTLTVRQYRPGFFDDDDPMAMHMAAMMQRGGRPARRFDEYFRCYPIAMMRGPDREETNHGGKVFLPPSALDKLTRLHITYPMLFELINGSKEKTTHAGVLEFTAEEGRMYVPRWLIAVLELEVGDLIQVKSTDLPSGTFIKLQPQSVDFLDISDPKAVLENAFRNFSCLTTGDVFTFHYNDKTYGVAVLETRPDNDKKAICTLETDLSVDFAPPVGYKEPERTSGTSTPRSMTGGLAAQSGTLHAHGTMAQAINYASIAPTSSAAPAVPAHFQSTGYKLSSKKPGKVATPKPATPVAGKSANAAVVPIRKTNGPQPLRLPPGKLFFGYEIVPVRNKDEKEGPKESVHFQGQGQSLRKKKGDK